MRLVVIITALITLLLFGSFVIGLTEHSDTFIEKEIIIDAPESVIFNIIIDFNRYSDWNILLNHNEFDAARQQRKSGYNLWPVDLVIIEDIEVNIQERIVIFKQSAENPPSYLKNFTNSIRLISLPDGSTNIFWGVSYTIEPVYSRFLNWLLIKPQLARMVTGNLEELKNILN
jgi:hypothetical protein